MGLNEVFNESKLSYAKLSHTKRIFVLGGKGDITYWNKNGIIKLFNDQILIYPNIDYKMTSNLWATTITLYYNENKLRKLFFQAWSDKKSKYHIVAIFNDFIKCFQGIFGIPTIDEDKNEAIWIFIDSVFSAKLSKDSKNAWFTWI